MQILKITRHFTCSHVLPVPNEPEVRIEEKKVFKRSENVNKQKEYNFDTSTGNCLRSYSMQGVAYLHVRCCPQHECPSHWFLDPYCPVFEKSFGHMDLS